MAHDRNATGPHARTPARGRPGGRALARLAVYNRERARNPTKSARLRERTPDDDDAAVTRYAGRTAYARHGPVDGDPDRWPLSIFHLALGRRAVGGGGFWSPPGAARSLTVARAKLRGDERASPSDGRSFVRSYAAVSSSFGGG